MTRRALPWIAGLLLAAATPASAASTETITDATVDVALFRTLGAVSTAVGGVMFIPAALFSAPNGRDGIEEAWKIFVEHPYETTFERPLGEF